MNTELKKSEGTSILSHMLNGTTKPFKAKVETFSPTTKVEKNSFFPTLSILPEETFSPTLSILPEDQTDYEKEWLETNKWIDEITSKEIDYLYNKIKIHVLPSKPIFIPKKRLLDGTIKINYPF